MDEVWIRETKDKNVIKKEVYCIVQISITFKRLFYSTRIILVLLFVFVYKAMMPTNQSAIK